MHMLRTALIYDDGPVALRYPRGEAVGVPLPDASRGRSRSARGELLREGERVALLGYGTGVAEVARGGRPARRARARRHRRRRPLRQADRPGAARPARGRARAARHGRGGRPRRRLRLGGARDAQRRRACEMPRVLRVGLPDRYVTHGKPALLHREVGFTGKAIAERILSAVGSPSLSPTA